MNKIKTIATLLFITCSFPLWAQGLEVSGISSIDTFLVLGALILVGAIFVITILIRREVERRIGIMEIRRSKGQQVLKSLVVMSLFLGASGAATAQDVAEQASSGSTTFTIFLVVLNIILLLVLIWLWRKLSQIKSLPIAPVTPEEEIALRQRAKAQPTLTRVLTDAVPVEQEEEIMLDHVYDGIRELDNNLPPWWVWMFYATIIYSFIYLIYHHVLPFSKTQTEKYYAEMEQAEAEIAAYKLTVKDLIDENTVEYLSDASNLTDGKKIYDANCMACHAMDGGGGVGPNLTDEYWLHGGGIKDIYRTVKYGVPTKGMIAWESQLTPTQMAQVSSYIKSLGGTTPANPKEPQGDLWNPENESEGEETKTEGSDA